MRRFVFAILVLASLMAPALGQTVTPIPPPCTVTSTSAPASTLNNYSGNVTTSSAALIPAAPQGVIRTGIFIQCLSATCTLAVNLSGATASTSTAGNMVATGQFSGFNFATLGFIPQGAITAIADGTRAVTAFACPR